MYVLFFGLADSWQSDVVPRACFKKGKRSVSNLSILCLFECSNMHVLYVHMGLHHLDLFRYIYSLQDCVLYTKKH